MTQEQQNPATLVAIIVAARRAGNRELEREMRRELEEAFAVKLTFVRAPSGGPTRGDRSRVAPVGRPGSVAR